MTFAEKFQSLNGIRFTDAKLIFTQLMSTRVVLSKVYNKIKNTLSNKQLLTRLVRRRILGQYVEFSEAVGIPKPS